MGKIEGVRIQNFGPLRDIVMGKTLSNQKNAALNYRTEWKWKEYSGRCFWIFGRLP